MVNKKQSEENANLKNALDDAMTEFGANDDSLVIDKSLIIDESPRSVKKKPLKLRLSVGSLSDFNVENGSTPKFNNFSMVIMLKFYIMLHLKYIVNILIESFTWKHLQSKSLR